MPDHSLRQLSARVWWLNPIGDTDRPTLGVVAGAAGSLIVDAGNSPAHAHALLAEIQRHGLPAPRFVALTHWHWDHVFGAATFNLPSLASVETGRVLRVMSGLDWDDGALDERVADGREIAFCGDMIRRELPDRAGLIVAPAAITFADSVTVDLGDRQCVLAHVGGDHSPDAIIVHVPQERVVFFGDAIYDDIYHGPRRLTAAGLFPLLDRLLALDVDHYVGGHDPAPIGRAQFAADAAELRAIGALVATVGDDRDATLAGLPDALGATPNEDHIAIADAFLAGLRMPLVSSPL